jgi:tetratricopeptide (TPR) repeat protein
MLKILGLAISALVLGGCTSQPLIPPSPPLTQAQLWQDEAFHYHAEQTVENIQSLLQLDDALVSSLKLSDRQDLSVDRRIEIMIAHLYGPNGINLNYQSGHSTGAMQTWQAKRGDCLSLTLLTYAVTQALGIPAHMQEVRVPPVIDRRSGVDFINGHVNVFIRNSAAVRINGHSFQSGGIVIDFEPQVGSRQWGVALSESEIAARYYNNRASENLLAHDFDRAYAYYRAAIGSDPQFAAAYGNLGLLYVQHGLTQSAERLLRHAIALNGSSNAPLHALLQLLRTQGRTEEATQVAAQLEKRQTEDPYYWLGQGLQALQKEQYGKAVYALQRAEALAVGFAEIHRYLAYAYWRNQQPKRAREQLALLTALDELDPGVSVLQKKMSAAKLVQ